MNHLDVVDKFWEHNSNKVFGSSATALYFFLLNRWHESKYEDFSISDKTISVTLGIARSTVRDAKERLLKHGLIECHLQKGLPCQYKIVIDFSKHFIREQKKELNESVKIKKVTNVSKEILPIPKNQESDLEKKSFQRGIPSFSQFLEFAKSLSTYTPELDEKIQSKYEQWLQNDWKNNFNRPITNWKATLKNAVPYLANVSVENSHSIDSLPSIKRTEIIANQRNK